MIQARIGVQMINMGALPSLLSDGLSALPTHSNCN